MKQRQPFCQHWYCDGETATVVTRRIVRLPCSGAFRPVGGFGSGSFYSLASGFWLHGVFGPFSCVSQVDVREVNVLVLERESRMAADYRLHLLNAINIYMCVCAYIYIHIIYINLC